MLGSMYIAAQAMGVGSMASAVTANNIANANTQSFHARSTSFSDMLNGGVKISTVRIDPNPGSVMFSGSPTDLTLYDRFSGDTRSFKLDSLALYENGYQFQPLENANLRVDAQGYLYTNDIPIGQLNSIGGNNYGVSTGEELLRGYQVSSNVNIAKEMVDNMVNVGYFKANASVIRATDEMVGSLLSIRA